MDAVIILYRGKPYDVVTECENLTGSQVLSVWLEKKGHAPTKVGPNAFTTELMIDVTTLKNLTTKEIPAECFPLGEFIKNELESRRRTQFLLHEEPIMPMEKVRELLENPTETFLTLEEMRSLSRNLNIKVTFLMNIQNSYKEWKEAVSKIN